jgi:hypothetical protein
LPCYLALPVIIMAMLIRTATTDKSKSSFPRVPSLGAAGCGGLGSRGDFLFGRLASRRRGYLKGESGGIHVMSEASRHPRAAWCVRIGVTLIGFAVGVIASWVFIFPPEILSIKLAALTTGDLLRILGGLIFSCLLAFGGFALGCLIAIFVDPYA